LRHCDGYYVWRIVTQPHWSHPAPPLAKLGLAAWRPPKQLSASRRIDAGARAHEATA
jgi:hypothetical protein